MQNANGLFYKLGFFWKENDKKIPVTISALSYFPNMTGIAISWFMKCNPILFVPRFRRKERKFQVFEYPIYFTSKVFFKRVNLFDDIYTCKFLLLLNTTHLVCVIALQELNDSKMETSVANSRCSKSNLISSAHNSRKNSFMLTNCKWTFCV